MKAYMASEKLTLWVSFQIPTTSAGFPLQKPILSQHAVFLNSLLMSTNSCIL